MSIERTLRGLETIKARLENEITRDDKALAEYKAQSEKPFEHEKRLKELLAEQKRLNAALDLDKDDRQAITATTEDEEAAPLDVDSITDSDTPERSNDDNDYQPVGIAAPSPA